MGLFDFLTGAAMASSSDMTVDESAGQIADPIEQCSPLLNLPSEVLHQVLSHLECQSLVSLSLTCRKLHTASQVDLLWADLLHCIPAADYPRSPYPAPTYRDLYVSHHPYWFVPRAKIWLSNDPHIGKVMLCRYDPRRGCIEGYRLLAERGPSQSLLWPYNRNVVIHTFKPRIHLWLDDPILTLAHGVGPVNTKQGWWEGEIKMSVGRPGHNTSASFFLSRDVPDDPRMAVWPPRTIPGMPRVRSESLDKFRGKGHKPQKFKDISTTTFRMRHWSQFSTGLSHFGVRIGEEVSTWSTLDPSLYVPTPEKPYQGIYVGDYAGHGCEFLLVMHTEKAPPPPEPPVTSLYAQGLMELEVADIEAAGDLHDVPEHALDPDPHQVPRPFPPDAAARDDDRVFTGALEAVKLTGDPNVPRGEHTFIADDIGPGGLIRIAKEHPFTGARVVKSRGHVAARGFMHHEFIPSQLLMINHNCLAQYWVPFGHISFYQRVDIDEVMGRIFHGKRPVTKLEEQTRK